MLRDIVISLSPVNRELEVAQYHKKIILFFIFDFLPTLIVEEMEVGEAHQARLIVEGIQASNSNQECSG